MSDISILVISVIIVIVVMILDNSRQKQITTLRNDFKTVLSVVESLKFRVFDHENQLMGRDGVFIPEDTGITVFKMIWSILDERTQKEVEEEYKDVCPSHIPLWKYVIYSYKFSPNFERKIDIRNIETIEDMINGNLKNTVEAIEKMKSHTELLRQLENKVNNISNELNDVIDKNSDS